MLADIALLADSTRHPSTDICHASQATLLASDPSPASLPPPPASLLPRLQLLYDGQDAEAVRLLAQVSSVTLTHIHPPFASPADLAKYALWTGGINASSHRQWGGQPGNYELMVKQG